MGRKIYLIAAFFVFGSALPGYGQYPASDSLANLYIDFSVPDLAAFTLLDFNTDQVARPGNVKELSVSLINAVGKNGRVNQGVAFEWSPFQSFIRPKSLAAYRDPKNSLLRNISVSYAAVKDSSNIKLGFAVQWVVLDNSDILQSREAQKELEKMLRLQQRADPLSPEKVRVFTNEIATFFAEIQPDPALRLSLLELLNPGELKDNLSIDTLSVRTVYRRLESELRTQDIYDTLSEAQKSTLNIFVADYIEFARLAAIHLLNGRVADLEQGSALTFFKEEWKADHWNAAVVHFGFGTIFNSPSSSFGDLGSDQFGTYASAAVPLFSNMGQFIGQLKYRKSYRQQALEEWRYSLGGRVLYGNSDNRLSVEALFSDSETRNMAMDGAAWRLTLGAEFKLSEGLWLELATGVNIPDTGSTQLITLGGLKYAIKRSRMFNFPG